MGDVVQGRFGARARLVDDDQRVAFMEAVAERLAGIETERLKEIWTLAGRDVPGGPYFVVQAVHAARPDRGYEIDASSIFVRIAGYDDLEIALTAAEIIADHFRVPAVDHTNFQPESAA